MNLHGLVDSGSALYLLPAWPVEYMAQAHARAEDKAARAYSEGPVPRNTAALAKGVVSVLLTLLSFSVWTAEGFDGVLGLLAMVLTAGSAVYWIFKYAASSSPGPVVIVLRWLEGANTKRFEQLFASVTAYDRDDFPRYSPATHQVGPPLNAGDVVVAYWQAVFERFGVIGGRFWPRALRSRFLTPRIALVEGEVFAHNPGPRPWMLIVGALGVAGLVVLLMTQFPQEYRATVLISGLSLMVVGMLIVVRREKRTVRLKLRKVVVRSGGGWRVLSGEWCGPEDHDLSWIPQAVPGPGETE